MNTLAYKYANRQPTFGGRSRTYIGINFEMDVDFFPVTSDGKTGARRSDPRLRCSATKKQRQIYEEFVIKARESGVGGKLIATAWSGLVSDANEVATDAAKIKTREKDLGYIIYSKTREKEVSRAIRAGEASLLSAIHMIGSDFFDQLSIDDQFDLDLGQDENSTIFYILHDRDDIYKIGKTKRPAQRAATYRTHSYASELVNSYQERGILTEANIISYWKRQGCWVRNEFFRFDENQLNDLSRPVVMEYLLKSEQK